MRKKLLKSITISLFTIFFISPTFASDGQDGSGGGGITRNGKKMTFYSAGFYTEPTELIREEVPQLKETLDFFYDSDLLGEFTKVKYIRALLSSPERHYYKVKEASFTSEVKERLIAEFGRVMNLDTTDIALFAITDTNNGTTYLLPEFYNLLPIEQMAILFHEAFWMINPNATYRNVIDAEMNFQAHLENPNSAERLLRWVKSIGGENEALIASVRYDLKNKRLRKIMERGKIKVSTLFGKRWINCMNQGYGIKCNPFIQANIFTLRKKSPKSLLLIFLENSAAKDRLSLQRKDWNRPINAYEDIRGICPNSIYGTLDLENLLYSKEIKIPINVKRKKNYYSCSSDYILNL